MHITQMFKLKIIYQKDSIYITLDLMYEIETQKDAKIKEYLSRFSILQSEQNSCSGKNKIEKMCINSQCTQNALVCSQKDCSLCTQNHISCQTIPFQRINNHKRAPSQTTIIETVYSIEKELINELEKINIPLIEKYLLKQSSKKQFKASRDLFTKMNSQDLKKSQAYSFLNQTIMQEYTEILNYLTELTEKYKNIFDVCLYELNELKNEVQFSFQSQEIQHPIIKMKKIFSKPQKTNNVEGEKKTRRSLKEEFKQKQERIFSRRNSPQTHSEKRAKSEEKESSKKQKIIKCVNKIRKQTKVQEYNLQKERSEKQINKQRKNFIKRKYEKKVSRLRKQKRGTYLRQIEEPFIESNILLKQASKHGSNGVHFLVEYLSQLLENPLSIERIFRASEHNFKASEFHKACDDVFNTLILIRTDNGTTIGGYTHQSWAADKKIVEDSQKGAFIFSLNMMEKFVPVKKVIYRNGKNGPQFGEDGQCDICIKDLCHTQKNSFANFPQLYNREKGQIQLQKGQKATKQFLGVSNKFFRVQEYEVFRVIYVK